MKAAIALVIAIAAVALVAVWYRSGDGESVLHTRVAAEHERMASRTTLAPSAVLAIRPDRGLPLAPPAARVVVPPLTREVIDSRPLKPVYDRLVAKTDRTGEEDWALATAMRCARTTESRKKNPNTVDPPKRVSQAERREKFAAALPAKAANRERRLAAFDGVVGDACDGFADVEVSEKDITALLEAGAAKGDAKARVALLEQQWMHSIMASMGQGRGAPQLADADLATLKDIGSGPDPVAALQAMQGMLRNYSNFSLRVSDSEEAVDLSAMYTALRLTGCDYGAECGPDNRMLRQACAMQGRCDVANLRDYMLFYNSSPASSQLVDQYADAIRRARRGDWSYFSFFPGPTPSTANWR